MLNHLINLNPFTLLTTGRTGSDFLQSMLDSHPQVLTFNGSFDYYTFWDNSTCVKSGSFEVSDFVDELVGKFIEKFKSRYDIIERKEQLGINSNQSIDIDISEFKEKFKAIIGNNEVNSKNCLLAIYGAYSLAIGQGLTKKEVFFHHIHHHHKLDRFLEDFPTSKIISMTRDPRANIYSGVTHHKSYNPNSMGGAHQYFYIKRILEDCSALEKYDNEYISIKLESLGSINTLENLADWLGIVYDKTLSKSTWAGLEWQGDKLSGKKTSGGKFSNRILQNGWEKNLSKKDKYIFNYLMNSRLKSYGYSYEDKSFLSHVLVPVLNLLPLSYEKEMFSPFYIYKNMKDGKHILIIHNIISFLKRIILFQKYYWKELSPNSINYPYLK
jgi:hypothetical protein